MLSSTPINMAAMIVPGMLFETANDDDWEDLQRDQPDAEAASVDEGPERAANDADSASHTPYEQEVPGHIDAYGHRHLLVIGYRTQGYASAATLMKPGKHYDRERRYERGQQLVGRNM
jgi:hypothetical protein